MIRLVRSVGGAIALLSLSLSLPNVYAQGAPTGVITGVVKDESGAVVAGTHITAFNPGTSASFQTVASDTGIYLLRALPVGSYRVTAEKDGFKKSLQDGVLVRVNEEVRLDVTLSVGAVSEVQTVVSQATTVDTVSSTLKNVIDQRRINELPLNGRNSTSLMLLVAGVQPDQTTSLTSGATYPGVSPVSANGARGNTTNYVLDGGSNNDHYSNAPNPMPNPDALQEFSVQTNNFSAEYGRNLGAVVNAVTKSGTNQIHGSAFEYLRHHSVNAANFFTPSRGDGLKRNQFGATIGGPIWLPEKIFGPAHYNGSNRSFFFFSYQGTRLRQAPADSTAIVPTEAQRRGNFSSLAMQLKNPFNNGQLFPNNQIPMNLINPIAEKIIDERVPLPTEPSGLLRFSVPIQLDDNQYLARVDHQIGADNHVYGRFWVSQAGQPPYLDPKNYLAQSFGRVWRNTAVSINDNHTFSPRFINNFVFTFNRTNNDNFQIYPPSLASLGAQYYNDGFPQYNLTVSGYFTINTGDTNTFLRNEYQIADTAHWSVGRHELSFGGDYSYGQGDIVNNFRANGQFGWASSAPFSGDALADFFLGKFATFVQGIGEYKNTRFHYLGLFVQDNLRVNRKLTLNLGLRWDPFSPYTDVNGHLAGFRSGRQSRIYVNAPRGVLYPGDEDFPDGGYDASWANFGPRIGFAYDLFGDGKTSLRSGYGIFYDRPNTISTNGAADQGPFGTLLSFNGNSFNNFSDPYAGRDNPFPLSSNPKPDVAFPLPHTVFSYDPDFRNACLQSWHLSVEREIFASALLRVAYAGSKGTRLAILRELNAAVYAPGATTATTNQRRPFAPAFSNITNVEATGNSIYHSLQATFDKRFSRGLSLLASYTWSRSLDDSSENKQTGVSRTNPYDQRFDRGPSNFDHTHNFTASWLWELPMRFDRRMTNALIGGWKLSGILTLQSGLPFTVTSGVDNARTGAGGQRPDQMKDWQFPDDRSRNAKILQWFDPSAFLVNALGTYGTVGRNSLRGPGSAALNLGLHKDFPIRESFKFQFRFETFNALNNVNLGLPNGNRSSSAFGRITTAGDPRLLQFALRIGF
jgi:outer membrane receptor protein involved in Fe transport